MCGMIHHFIDLFSALECRSDESPPDGSSSSSYVQPLLLIVILDAIGQKAIVRNFISPSPELEAKFYTLMEEIQLSTTKEDFAAAFSSLKHSGFWHLVPRILEGHEVLQDKQATDRLRNRYLGARFSEDLYPLLVMEPSRDRLRQILVEGYFPQELAGQLTRSNTR